MLVSVVTKLLHLPYVFVVMEGNKTRTRPGLHTSPESVSGAARSFEMLLCHDRLKVYRDCMYLCSPDMLSSTTGNTNKGALDHLARQQLGHFPADPKEQSSKAKAFEGQNDVAMCMMFPSYWTGVVANDPVFYKDLHLEDDVNRELFINLEGQTLKRKFVSFNEALREHNKRFRR